MGAYAFKKDLALWPSQTKPKKSFRRSADTRNSPPQAAMAGGLATPAAGPTAPAAAAAGTAGAAPPLGAAVDVTSPKPRQLMSVIMCMRNCFNMSTEIGLSPAHGPS